MADAVTDQGFQTYGAEAASRFDQLLGDKFPAGDQSQQDTQARERQTEAAPQSLLEQQANEAKPTSEATEKKPDEIEKKEVAAEVPEDTSPEGKEKYKWGELKKEVKTQKERLAAYEKAEAEWKANSEEFTRSKEELTRLQKQIEEANRELYTVRVEATPEWNKTVKEPLAKIIDQVNTVAKMNAADPDKLLEAVDKASKGDRSLLKEITENMETFDRDDLYRLSKELINVDSRIAELKKNSKEAYETSLRSQEEQRDQQSQQILEIKRKAVDKVGEMFQSKVQKFLPEDHQVDFSDIKSKALELDSWSPEEKALAGYMAWSAPDLIKALETWQQRAVSAEEQNVKLRSGAPKGNSSGTAPSSPKDVTKPPTQAELAKKSFEDYGNEATQRFSHLLQR